MRSVYILIILMGITVGISGNSLGNSQFVDTVLRLDKKIEDKVEMKNKEMDKMVEKKPEKEKYSKDLKQRYRERYAEDQKKYTPDQIQEIKQLYKIFQDKPGTPEAEASLKKLIEKYIDHNLTGFAVITRGDSSFGEEKVKYLKLAIDRCGDSTYEDGVIVGAYARYLLGKHYTNKEQPDKAEPFFTELKLKFPGAIDHRGKPLLEK